jgi:lipopolysaccharide/colanic/teichoic acid biosynthesis glycosyltransferase
LALADRFSRPPATETATGVSSPPGALLNRRQRTVKRVFDVAVASAALLVAWPLLLLAAGMVKMSSPGPAVYRHRRVGQNGAMFDVLKYRTMYVSQSPADWQITVAGDPRITPVGRWLRRTKLDELPQLWNVLRGEMSIVGWRPHVAGYPDRLTGRNAMLIEERPGITGTATLFFREEERMLALTDDPKRHYDDVIYPAKVRMDLEYFRAWSLKQDVACLIVTAWPAADRWLRIVPTVASAEQASTEASPRAVAAAGPIDTTQFLGNGYRRVVPLPVWTNGHATNGHATNGHATNGHATNGHATARLRAGPSAALRVTSDDPGLLLEGPVVLKAPASIGVAGDDVESAIAASSPRRKSA